MTGTGGHSDDRRNFFRQAAARMIGPLSDLLSEGSRDEAIPVYLRPPGAIEEAGFLDACQHCGACVEACPARAIFSLGERAGGAAGTPVIDPDSAACVVCDGLLCTHVCPNDALLPLSHPHEIQMGVAEVYGSLCLRSDGEACAICVEQCPLGEAAIGFSDDGPPRVVEDGCVGCGVCQLFCPTSPKAITVRAKAEVG